MAIKNYTSEIMVDYDGKGQPTGITFGLETSLGPRCFALPANVADVRTVFQRQKLKVNEEQIERTAWRNLRDWVLAQMAIIEAGQVVTEQVFLPYLCDKNGQTLFERYQANQLFLDAPDREGD